jgi:hypothetical protein
MNRLRMIQPMSPLHHRRIDWVSVDEGERPRRPLGRHAARPRASPVVGYSFTEAGRWSHFRRSLKATLSILMFGLALLSLGLVLAAMCGRP